MIVYIAIAFIVMTALFSMLRSPVGPFIVLLIIGFMLHWAHFF